MKHYFVTFLAAVSISFGQTKSATISYFTPDPNLPNVLIIGDSISIGYTPDVRESLKGKANVYRPMNSDGKGAVNCTNTAFGLSQLSKWLGTTKWGVIHFNWGLHDLCYRSPESKVQGRRDKVHGLQDVPLPQYGPNLEKLVTQLERTRAKLIWASTTVVPDGEAGRFAGSEIPYNLVARDVMARHGIPTDDLYALTKSFPATLFQEPGNVHYTNAGYERIAEQVAAAIEAAMGR